MQRKLSIISPICKAISTVILVTGLSVPAYAVVDDDAKTVYLRGDCTENGAEIANCFTTTGAFTSWLANTATSSEVTAQVGPGTFGYFSPRNLTTTISLMGSGPELTSFNGMGPGDVTLHVQDLTVNNWFPAPVYWNGGGSSTWTNVHLNGGIYGWTETGCENVATRPKHYWFSSKITAALKTAYQVGCSETWFFGTELTVNGNGMGGVGMSGLFVLKSSETNVAEAHVYGSVIRAVVADGVTYNPGEIAAVKVNGGIVHIHGTGIDVIGNSKPNDIAALNVSNGGSVHASQSAYVMQTGSGGFSHRIINAGGTVKAPYAWEDLSDTALLTTLRSSEGADTFIEPNCAATGCQTTGNEPHMLIYSSNCTGTGGPWFDIVTRQCR